MSSPDSPESSEELRSELVATAVKFLANPKVLATPESQRRAFLVKKGLTEAEISAALEQAGASPELPATAEPPLPVPVQAAPPVLRSHSHPWLRGLQSLVVLGGGGYALYRLARDYLLPTFFGVPNPERERLRLMQEQLTEVSHSLKFLMDSVQQTLSAVRTQQDVVQRALGIDASASALYGASQTGPVTKADLAELRTEVGMLKSLLLSRSQFAPVPPSLAAPIIPAWQRGGEEQRDSSGSDSGTTPDEPPPPNGTVIATD